MHESAKELLERAPRILCEAQASVHLHPSITMTTTTKVTVKTTKTTVTKVLERLAALSQIAVLTSADNALSSVFRSCTSDRGPHTSIEVVPRLRAMHAVVCRAASQAVRTVGCRAASRRRPRRRSRRRRRPLARSKITTHLLSNGSYCL